jgi:hypothetical protein
MVTTSDGSASNEGGGRTKRLTDKMVPHSSQLDLPFKLGVSQDFSTDSVAPSICDDDLSRRNVDDARGEALLKFGVKFGWDWGENRDCWEQSVGCGSCREPVGDVSICVDQ